jgi:hypothetical protein
LGGSFYAIEKKIDALVVASKDIGLEVNADKSVSSRIETMQDKTLQKDN